MPPRSKYSFGEYRKNANKVFTNRESFISLFYDARSSLRKGKHSLLNFYGVGGEGKSALCRKLIEITRDDNPKTSALGLVDFSVESHRRSDRALLELRKSIRSNSNGKIKFPAFEIAILQYWEKEYPELNLRDALKDIFDKSEDTIAAFADNLKDWTDYAKDLPAGIGLVVKLTNYVRHKAKEKYLKIAKESLRDIEQLTNHELLQKLPYIFASDILAYLEQNNSLDVVLCLDTYEALWEHSQVKTGIGSSEKDNWVKDLVRELPGALFVIFGREKLTWDLDFPDEWAGYLDNQYLLTGLKDEDAEKYLRLIPILDTSVRAEIIEGAKGKPGNQLSSEKIGAHPFYLELAADLHLGLLDEGKLAEAKDIGKTPREVLDRFLKYRSKEEIETLRVLSVAYGFDQNLFNSLVTHYQTGYPLTAFSDFIKYSFIQHGQDGRYYLHALMREHLLETLDSSILASSDSYKSVALDSFKLESIRDNLFKYYNDLLPSTAKEVSTEHEFALQQAFRYLNWDDPENAYNWYDKQIEVFYEAAKYDLLIPIAFEILSYLETNLAQQKFLIAMMLDQLGRLYQSLGNYHKAEPLYKEALKIRKEIVRVLEFSERSHAHLAAGFNNLALVCEKLNRDKEALPLYEEALAIYQEHLPNYHEGIANIMNNIAQIFFKSERYDLAKPYYLESIALYEKSLPPDHPAIANSLNNLALLYKRQQWYSKAERMFKRSLAIREKCRHSEHPDIANSLHNLASLYFTQGWIDEAEPLLLKAISIREKTLPADHPELIESLECLKLINSLKDKI
jgi:tetratricopeptide (TPR) repeat protein